MNTVSSSVPARAPRWLGVVLWAGQIVLALGFGSAGLMKTFMGAPELIQAGMGFVADTPIWLVRFIGVAELAGAIGIILPATTRILPMLTPLAALGFAVIQILAIMFHAMRGELATSWPVNITLLLVSLFIVWGRARRAPITPR